MHHLDSPALYSSTLFFSHLLIDTPYVESALSDGSTRSFQSWLLYDLDFECLWCYNLFQGCTNGRCHDYIMWPLRRECRTKTSNGNCKRYLSSISKPDLYHFIVCLHTAMNMYVVAYVQSGY